MEVVEKCNGRDAMGGIHSSGTSKVRGYTHLHDGGAGGSGGEATEMDDESRDWGSGGAGTDEDGRAVWMQDGGARDTCMHRTLQGTHLTSGHATSPKLTIDSPHTPSKRPDSHGTCRNTITARSARHAHVAPVLVLVRRGATHRDDLPVPTGWRSWGYGRSCVPRCIGPGAVPGPVLGGYVPSCASGHGTHGGGGARACPGGSHGGTGWRIGRLRHRRRGGGIDQRRTNHCPSSSQRHHRRPRNPTLSHTCARSFSTRSPHAVHNHLRDNPCAPRSTRHHTHPNTTGAPARVLGLGSRGYRGWTRRLECGRAVGYVRDRGASPRLPAAVGLRTATAAVAANVAAVPGA